MEEAEVLETTEILETIPDKEISLDEQIAIKFLSWANELPGSNPVSELHKSLSDRTGTYREYLHKIDKIIGYFIDTMGFVPSPSITNIIYDKLYKEGTSNDRTDIVSGFVTSLTHLRSTVNEDDDDFL